MQKRIGKVDKRILIIFAILTIIFFFLEVKSIHNVKTRNYENKLKAAQICQEAFRIIKEERLKRGFLIDIINDPNETGLVGVQYSPITQDRTDLSAILTSTNPNFAAVFVELLGHLKPNDTVAVALDGSYPALNIALYSACRVLQLKPIIISSASSAMWGANLAEFSWLDMERVLYENNFFPFKSSAATLGGEDDNGRGFSPEARALLEKAIKRNNINFLHTENFTTNLEERMKIYLQSKTVKYFINIGKSVASVGPVYHRLPSGIIRRKPTKFADDVLITRMLDQKIPVINILDINRIATKYELPHAPIPLPPIGKGKLYIEKKFSVTLAIVFTVIIIIILFFVIKYDLEYYLFKKKVNP
ncbi:MAG: poly-gamma-glutamate system protein [candidate division WOR-3 bacterium]|nr:poly-gamma-glutamate system protein [candidate division WOR-3 bacterium]MCX7757120.1 poly-gamma-glutamate system protein [candidate division WOR-3 bacterium]MDW7988003.1 poly-gamma-glutamate system protein [candidate division WOR-3 bacterium]